MRLHSEKPVAIVAGIDLNGLGVVRSLGGAGVPVIALDTDLNKQGAWTRFGEKLQIASLSGSKFVDELMRLRANLRKKPVLFLTQEASVATVASELTRVQDAFSITLPAENTIRTLLDKHLFQGVAESLGFPLPRAITLRAMDSHCPPHLLRFPCILKPTTKQDAYGRQFAKAFRINSDKELSSVWGQIRNVVVEAIVQEWIEGGDDDVYFCLQYRGEGTGAKVSFVGRKLLQWPPLVGGTASCIADPEAAEELSTLTTSFFDAVGFVGIGSMEYKRDKRDGKFYMVEPTVGRTDYQEEIATLSGVNIPYAAYCDCVGIELPASRSFSTCAWRDAVATARAKEIGAHDPLESAFKHVKTYDAYFRARDPGPFLYGTWRAVKRRVVKLTRSDS